MCVAVFAGFHGTPVLLEDGSVIGSAALPQGSVREHPVTLSAESLYQSARSQPASSIEHPITFSGGSLMDSGMETSSRMQSRQHQSRARISAEGHPITFSGGSIMDSGFPGSSVTGSGTNLYESAHSLHPGSLDGRDINLSSSGTHDIVAERAPLDLAAFDSTQNESAANENLERYLEQAQGQPVHYHPLSLSDSTATRSGTDSIPGRRLPQSWHHQLC